MFWGRRGFFSFEGVVEWGGGIPLVSLHKSLHKPTKKTPQPFAMARESFQDQPQTNNRRNTPAKARLERHRLLGDAQDARPLS